MDADHPGSGVLIARRSTVCLSPLPTRLTLFSLRLGNHRIPLTDAGPRLLQCDLAASKSSLGNLCALLLPLKICDALSGCCQLVLEPDDLALRLHGRVKASRLGICDPCIQFGLGFRHAVQCLVALIRPSTLTFKGWTSTGLG